MRKARKGIEVSEQQESESRSERNESGDRSQSGASREIERPGIWLPFGLFVLGFLILVVESKLTLSVPEDYALKGLGGGICLVTVVWIRRQARKSGTTRRVNRNESNGAV
jgi:hypothetical protein